MNRPEGLLDPSQGRPKSKPRVAVIYDGFPHYRKAVIEELAGSGDYEYFFFGDPTYRDGSIKGYEFKPGINWIPTTSFSLGRFHVQRNVLRGVIDNHISHCIFLGNPWFVSYWLLVPLLRFMGKKVYFWSHGWIARDESRIRGTIKHAFFHMAHALLLYGKRAKEIGASHGFRSERMHVIGNSLDYRTQKHLFATLSNASQKTLRQEFGLPLEAKIIICTARLTRSCRFDLLIQAASKLAGHDVFLLLVGEGPESEPLAALASSLSVPHRFWGACYEEPTIAKLYKASDLTVSPGKVGLTAMHSMAYGTPVITHGNFDHQMPEFESIIAGVTGDFFSENSSDELARVILEWFDRHPVKPEQACIARIEAEFTPWFQRHAIEAALQGNPAR